MMMQLSGILPKDGSGFPGPPPKGGSGTSWPITDCAWCSRKQVECRRVNHNFYCKTCYKGLHGLERQELKPLPQWEYIEFTFREFADLQQHGLEGWEIISITPQASGYRHAVGKRELRPPEAFVPKAVVEREVRESD